MFSYCSICTELHCRMYCCEIKTNMCFVTISTVPTSSVTFTVTFIVAKFCLFVLKITVGKTPKYNVPVPTV